MAGHGQLALLHYSSSLNLHKESGVRRYGIGASDIVRRTKVVSIYHFILLSSSA